MIFQNEDQGIRRRVPVLLVDSNRVPVEGIVDPPRTITKSDLTVIEGGGIWTEVGGGVYYLELTEGQVGTLGFLAIRIAAAGARVQSVFVQVVAFDPYVTPGFPEAIVRKWGAAATAVADGTEAVDNSYRAIVEVLFNDAAAAQRDEWTVVWADEAGPRTVTGAKMSLHDRAGNITLGESTMTLVAGSYKLDVTAGAGANARIPAGEARIATFKATIDGEVRTYRAPVQRA